MKRLYWYAIINTIALIVLAILGSYLDALCFEKERWIGHLLLYAYIGITIYLESRKTPITLTEEELQAPVPERQDFSPETTKPRWIGLAIGIPAFFVVMFLFSFSDMGMYEVFKGAPFKETLIKHLQLYGILFQSITFRVVMIVLGVFAVFGYKRMSRNKYIIDGDTLIIQENRTFKIEEEIRIPLDTIDEVYLRFNGTGLSGLYLNIQGIKRRLNTGVNSLSLGKAILQHKNSFSRFADSQQECR